MNKVMVIAKKEFGSFFDSLVAYILLAAFLGFSGFFTWIQGSDIFMRREADLDVFFSVARWTLFFFIPALTMKMVAEEKKTGTIEMLLTKAVTDREVVIGKFVGCLMLVGVALVFTLPYYVSVSWLGKMDHGATITGYLGLLLMSAAYIAIGIFASSVTNNQIVAFLLALLIGIFFHLLFDFIAAGSSGYISELFQTLSLTNHYDSISRGVLDSKDIIYFLSITGLGLFLSEYFISKR
ncbi:MAG: ABC transporter permease subunit [Saprospiraceae bacterium]|nr:ABC transporter permease subunit [Saprospiraceae bacterium]